jgi:hypothetical protein
MEADYECIIQRLRTAPPTCVSGFKLTPAELPEPWDDNPRSVWQLACPCGSEHARLLGYAISDYTDWPGGENIFISPIGFECAACGEVTEILDTDIHGYNAEVGKLEPDGVGSVKYRGEGPRLAYPCPGCGGKLFAVTVGFVFWPGAIEVFLDEPGWRWEDFFSAFVCYCRCVGCGQLCQPTYCFS